MTPTTTPSPLGTTYSERTALGMYTWTDRNRDVWWHPATARTGDPPVRIGRTSTLDDAARIVRRHRKRQRQEQP